MIFKRPMLAAPLLKSGIESTDENILAAMQKLRYPVLATIKKDGIRALRLNKSLLSRTLKTIPNKSIRERSLKLPGGFDMELWNPELTYDQVESIVMSQEHPDSDKIQFHVLDWLSLDEPYEVRWSYIAGWLYDNQDKVCLKDTIWSTPYECNNPDELFACFQHAERINAEGICFRTPDSPYKQGRSTLKEQYLIKLCRYVREEVTILTVNEQEENGNPENRNGVGLMDRSSCQHLKYGKGTMGSLGCLRKDGTHVSVGSGFDDRTRQMIWDNPHEYIGTNITIKYKPHGMKDKPRSPVFVGFRKEGY